MARKTKEDAQETYIALLDAAEQVFSEKGVTRTTLNDVATAAGMTRGAIYWHFKDKTALFQAMCDRAFLPMDALLNEIACTPDKDPIAALRQMSVHLLKQVACDQRQRKVFDIIFHRCEKTDEMAFFALEQEKRSECLSRMEAILQEAVAQGKLPTATDTWIAMRAIHSYLIGLIHEWLIDTKGYHLETHAEDMIDMFLAGLLARPPLKK
ncbi:MAG: TetR family transcriptional regulator [Undibacterium sp.]|uniref:TetR family transcriptional regulator n=1 Tax=Undibacterium sp. TaxID=1914977 RepID=UPI00271C56FB|nr:TetR family transcriptional regulator [Undibacterium sp.]MDO8650909.1 TetR family transcriptional regulator [Undibacterium sp.]